MENPDQNNQRKSPRPVRRIVTTNDVDGLSKVLLDGEAPKTIGVLTELWLTNTVPANNEGDEDNSLQSNQLEPTHNGTVFRFFEIAPQDLSIPLEERQRVAKEWFAEMNASHLQPDIRRDPTMHKSNSTDYIILLSGEITLVLDKEEIDLQPHDVVIQRGTNHAWVNKGKETAKLMAVLIAGETPNEPKK